MFLHAEQIRAARSLLGWTQGELAKKAKVGSMTVRRLEAGEGTVKGTIETLMRVQSTLEREGISFIPEDEHGSVGVRLNRKSNRKK